MFPLVALQASNINATITEAILKQLFPNAVIIHKHSDDIAFITYQKLALAEKDFHLRNHLRIDSQLILAICGKSICGKQIEIQECIMDVRFAPEHVGSYIEKAYNPRPPTLLQTHTNIKMFLTGSHVILCVHATSILTVKQWTELFPNCFYVHRTSSRNKAYIAYGDLQLAKKDTLATFGKTITILNKEETGYIYVRAYARITTEEELCTHILKKNQESEERFEVYEQTVKSVVQWILA